MEAKIDDALVDVRKAYRLVYMYQKHVLSVCEKFVENFNVEFCWWSPTVSWQSPQRGTNIFNRWTWDLLPLYSTVIHFKSVDSSMQDHASGDWLLSLELRTDTSFEDSGTEPHPSSFKNPDDSQSKIIISTKYCEKGSQDKPWHSDYWSRHKILKDIKEIDKIDDSITVVKKEYLLSEFKNEEAINQIANDYKKFLQNEIPDIGLS